MSKYIVIIYTNYIHYSNFGSEYLLNAAYINGKDIIIKVYIHPTPSHHYNWKDTIVKERVFFFSFFWLTFVVTCYNYISAIISICYMVYIQRNAHILFPIKTIFTLIFYKLLIIGWFDELEKMLLDIIFFKEILVQDHFYRKYSLSQVFLNLTLLCTPDDDYIIIQIIYIINSEMRLSVRLCIHSLKYNAIINVLILVNSNCCHFDDRAEDIILL